MTKERSRGSNNHPSQIALRSRRHTTKPQPMSPMPAFPPSTTVLDSILFRDAFGTPAMREVFSDFRLISRYAEVEIALAKAEARCDPGGSGGGDLGPHRRFRARLRSVAS
jgi:hypothetical protein